MRCYFSVRWHVPSVAQDLCVPSGKPFRSEVLQENYLLSIMADFMQFDLGLPILGRPERPARVAYSDRDLGGGITRFLQDDDVAPISWTAALSCGHVNLGTFFGCAGCGERKCPRCWNYCDPESIAKSILSVAVTIRANRDYERLLTQNTCKLCCDINSYCPWNCQTRQEKFGVRPKIDQDEAVLRALGRPPGSSQDHQAETPMTIAPMEYFVERLCPGGCECRVCENFEPFTVSMRDGRSMSSIIPRCAASRSYRYRETEKTYRRFPDEHICRVCFSTLWGSIEEMRMFIPQGEDFPWQYTVLARASEFSWDQTVSADPLLPFHYLHTLESGDSLKEEAVLHLGRHRACHGNGPCNVVSTSKLFLEAINRLSDTGYLHILCIPQSSLPDIATDMSKEDIFEDDDLVLACVRHKVSVEWVKELGLRFKEVCLSRLRLRNTPGIIAVEIPAALCTDLRATCSQALEYFHCDALQFLEAEKRCREFAIDAIQKKVWGDNGPWQVEE